MAINGDEMTTFNQQNQKVSGNQFNIGEIKLNVIQNKSDIPNELIKLITELDKAVVGGFIKVEVAEHAKTEIKSAVNETQKQNPNPETIIDYLGKAKTILEGFTSVTGLVTALVEGINMIRRVFLI